MLMLMMGVSPSFDAFLALCFGRRMCVGVGVMVDVDGVRHCWSGDSELNVVCIGGVVGACSDSRVACAGVASSRCLSSVKRCGLREHPRGLVVASASHLGVGHVGVSVVGWFC